MLLVSEILFRDERPRECRIEVRFVPAGQYKFSHSESDFNLKLN